jgi:quercetin dioxygenase-like cupin family protein
MGIAHIRSSAMPTDRSAIEGEGFTSTVTRFDAPPGPPGGWHHHGGHHVVSFLIGGTVRIEWGPNGRRTIEPEPGDLVHIEPGTVHRETYEGRVEIVGFSVGTGPGRVDVAGPDGGAQGVDLS